MAAALVAVPVLSGCVVFSLAGTGPQLELIGDVRATLTACASGSTGCAELGASGVPALSGTGQVLLGFRLQTSVSLPSSFTSTGPEALAFTESPSYAAELQRLDPAAPGTRWLGFISAVTNYSTTSGPQSFSLDLGYKLGRGADGSPSTNPLQGTARVGGRVVSAAAPGSRPVACGPSLTTLFDEDPSLAVDIYVICSDSAFVLGSPIRDLGVLNGAAGSGSPGGLALVPFSVRYEGAATPLADFRLSASTELAGATVAVEPATFVPPSNSTSVASVVVGIPAGARPGRYDLTLTARLANGQTRTGTGTLTVLSGPGAAGGGAVTARLRLTAILPRRLSARTARRKGITILIGATKEGFAGLQLFQGRGAKPKASKRVRLRVPGPTRVVLRSAKLRKGPYRIVIRADARAFVHRNVLTK